MFVVKYLRASPPYTPPQGAPPPTTRDATLYAPESAPRGGGWRSLWWGPLTILPQIFVFGAFFGPNKVLGMHLAPFLDEPSALEQKKFMLVPDAQC